MVGGIDGLHTFRECSDYLHRAVIVRVKIESGEATREAHRELTSHSFLALVPPILFVYKHNTYTVPASWELPKTVEGSFRKQGPSCRFCRSLTSYGGPEVTPDASHV